METKRLRTLTTGLLHTEVGFVYEDLEYITGLKGLMTHMLPNVMRAVEPWLREKVTDLRYWNEEFEFDLEGDYPLAPMTIAEKEKMLGRYKLLPNPLAGKETGVVYE